MDATKRWNPVLVHLMVGLAAATTLIGKDALAGGRLGTPPNDRWKAECGSCHIAYPPQLLPGQAWRRIMSQLDKHFGTDASGLDPAAAVEIGAYLERHAGSSARAQAAEGSLRITQSAWFAHEHDEVPPASWRNPKVKSASNCAACHTLAEQGDFRKRNLSVPR